MVLHTCCSITLALLFTDAVAQGLHLVLHGDDASFCSLAKNVLNDILWI